jgi:hypothetical protein
LPSTSSTSASPPTLELAPPPAVELTPTLDLEPRRRRPAKLAPSPAIEVAPSPDVEVAPLPAFSRSRHRRPSRGRAAAAGIPFVVILWQVCFHGEGEIEKHRVVLL